jgi:predicted helicase
MFQTYGKSIQDLYSDNIDDVTELSFRTSLENLLNSFIKERDYKLSIIHEAKRQKGKQPDFKIKNKLGINIGYVETKPIGENLKQVLESKQLSKYRAISDNIIVTDYLHFILIKKGEPVHDVCLTTPSQLLQRIRCSQDGYRSLESLLTIFFENQPEPIISPQDLAIKLSGRAKYLKEFCLEELQEQTKTKIDALYDVFQKSLLPDLDQKRFADIYAQTITYGLFLAFLNCENSELLNERTAYDYLPQSFSLVKELFHELEQFPKSVLWVIDEIISVLKCVKLESLLKEMSYGETQQENFVDPYIYFYEDFLSHYDKDLKKLQGVYFTPPPVVSFIVRSISKLLRDKFAIYDGFMNNQVTVLDFACGTGTFLVDVFRSAIQQAKKLGDSATVQKEVNGHMLRNFYGFELMVAPYVVAHLKISQFLRENNCPIASDKRLNIFLTNTLNTTELATFPFLPTLSSEGKLANEVKRQPILVILGNPPYNNRSSNVNEWILGLVEDYKPVDERKLNLNDDYIKFIRFAHWKMQNIEQGVVGIISNNSFLSGVTHRKMRGELLNSFDEIYILNLHGSSHKGETCPDGSKDENVFAIQQGVAISIFVKKKQGDTKCKVFSYDLYGLRKNKYKDLEENDVSLIKSELPIDEFNRKFKSTRWGRNRFKEDLNFFVLKDSRSILDYGEFWGITEIFKHYNSGIQTKRDKLTIQFSEDELRKILLDFKRYTDEYIRREYDLPPDNDGWELPKARKVLESTGFNTSNISQIHYRPFDIRYTYLTKQQGFLGRPRYETMNNLINKDNVGLVFMRQVVLNAPYTHFLVVKDPIDLKLFRSSEGTDFIAPLYIYMPTSTSIGSLLEGRSANFNDKFNEFMKNNYPFDCTPMQILAYIYAMTHSSIYRAKYLEFLTIDFPRIPFVTDKNLFLKLSIIGQELIEHHLMRKSYSDNVCHISGTGTNYRVEKVSYEGDKVYINRDRYFSPISKNIWEYNIGGHEVLASWLRERQAHGLDIDVRQFIQIANIANNTLRLIIEIDNLTSHWI